MKFHMKIMYFSHKLREYVFGKKEKQTHTKNYLTIFNKFQSFHCKNDCENAVTNVQSKFFTFFSFYSNLGHFLLSKFINFLKFYTGSLLLEIKKNCKTRQYDDAVITQQ